MGQVTRQRTTLSPGQAMGALILGGCPATAVRMVAAQSAVETFAWKSMFNWNMGNVTPSQQQVNAGISWITYPNIRNMRYVAYSSPIGGAQAMVGWLSAHGALSYASSGDLNGYMGRLQAACYLGCVGNVDPSTGQPVGSTEYANYRAGIAGYMQKFANVVPVPPPIPLTTFDKVLVGGAALTVAGAAVAFWKPEYLTGWV